MRRALAIGAAFIVLAEFSPSIGIAAVTRNAVHDFAVSIDENGKTYLDGRPLNKVLLELPEAVIQYGKSAKFYLWVDRRVEFGAVAKVLMAAGNVGAKRVSFGVPPGHPLPGLEATGIEGSFKIGSALPSLRDTDILLRVYSDGTIRGSNQETLDDATLGSMLRQAGGHSRPIYICPDSLSRWSSTIRLLTSAHITNSDIILMSGSC